MSKIINVNDTDNKPPTDEKRKPAFRGVAIRIDERGMEMQLQGINNIEAYGALRLLLDKLEKDLRSA